MTAEGMPLSQFYGLETNGLYSMDDATWEVDKKGKKYLSVWNQPTSINSKGETVYANAKAKPGDFRFVDRNNDGKITDADKTTLGSPIPKFIIGFSCNFEYKNFDLSMNVQSSVGNKIFNGAKSKLMNQDIGGNRSTDVLKQYRIPVYNTAGELIDEGFTDTNLPRLDPKGENSNFTRVSDYYVEDGSYVRIKNLQLGYTVPASLTSKVSIENLRVYVGVKNLLTLTKYSGFDPELGASDMLQQGLDQASAYPQARMFLMGVNLKF